MFLISPLHGFSVAKIMLSKLPCNRKLPFSPRFFPITVGDFPKTISKTP